jgi:hypothetical protein
VFSERGLLSQFRVVSFPANSTVQPGGTLEADIEFLPVEAGRDTASIVIRYAGSTSVLRRLVVYGTGKGAVVRPSHDVLPFIPEIPERELVLHNTSDITVQLVSARLTAGAPFTVLTALPVSIAPFDSIVVRIRYDGGAIPDTSAVRLSFDPCAVDRSIGLRSYLAQAVVSIPVVSADPRGDARIPINVDVTEPIPYAGPRTLEGSFTVNPRLFLARTVEVEGGDGELVSQEVQNDLRVVRYRITRRFDTDGVAGHIVGWAGLGEVDSSELRVDTAAANFGRNVRTTAQNGLLRILNPDPSRRIVDRPIPRVEVVPNPVNDRATVRVEATQSVRAVCRVVDAQGRIVHTLPARLYQAGISDVSMDLGSLLPGVYTVMLVSDSATVSATVVVL